MSISNSNIHEKQLIFNAYRQDEPIEGNYFRIPKALFFEPYNNLSLLAKNVYSLLLDRMELSRKNGWVNESGELFIFFEREEIAKILNYNVNTIVQAFKELRKYELVRETRQGIKKANIIYPGKIGFNCLNIEKLDSRISKNYSLESRKTIRSNTELSDPDFNDTEKNTKGNFHKENSLSSTDKNFSKWKLIMKIKSPTSLIDYTIKRFVLCYKHNIGKEHPPLKNDQLERCISVLTTIYLENDITEYADVDKIIDNYFETNFPTSNSDYRLNHFCTEEILQKRFLETCY